MNSKKARRLRKALDYKPTTQTRGHAYYPGVDGQARCHGKKARYRKAKSLVKSGMSIQEAVKQA